MLSRELQEKLVQALCRVPATDTKDGRDALLNGLPDNTINNLNRNPNNRSGDLRMIITQLDKLGRLTSGDWPLMVLIDNALQDVKGTELEQDMETIKGNLEVLNPHPATSPNTSQIHPGMGTKGPLPPKNLIKEHQPYYSETLNFATSITKQPLQVTNRKLRWGIYVVGFVFLLGLIVVSLIFINRWVLWDRLSSWNLLDVIDSPSLDIADFDSCSRINKLNGAMGGAYDPPNSMIVTYVKEQKGGCVAKLEYQIVTWSAFWLKLNSLDAAAYNTLTFSAKGDPVSGIPSTMKVEIKRNTNNEVGVFYISDLSASWQQIAIPLSEFETFPGMAPLSGRDNLSEIVFTFEASRSGSTGILYLDDIAFKKR